MVSRSREVSSLTASEEFTQRDLFVSFTVMRLSNFQRDFPSASVGLAPRIHQELCKSGKYHEEKCILFAWKVFISCPSPKSLSHSATVT